MAANVMTGNDENCAAWIAANRQATATTDDGREQRRERRRRREV
jgi:hypothetical protein